MTSEQGMHRSGPPAFGGGTRHTAHQGWPQASHCATACSVQCFVQFNTPDQPPRPRGIAPIASGTIPRGRFRAVPGS